MSAEETLDCFDVLFLGEAGEVVEVLEGVGEDSVVAQSHVSRLSSSALNLLPIRRIPSTNEASPIHDGRVRVLV